MKLYCATGSCGLSPQIVLREAGATREEVAEALGVAIAMNAGAAPVYATHTRWKPLTRKADREARAVVAGFPNGFRRPA